MSVCKRLLKTTNLNPSILSIIPSTVNCYNVVRDKCVFFYFIEKGVILQTWAEGHYSRAQLVFCLFLFKEVAIDGNLVIVPLLNIEQRLHKESFPAFKCVSFQRCYFQKAKQIFWSFCILFLLFNFFSLVERNDILLFVLERGTNFVCMGVNLDWNVVSDCIIFIFDCYLNIDIAKGKRNADGKYYYCLQKRRLFHDLTD